MRNCGNFLVTNVLNVMFSPLDEANLSDVIKLIKKFLLKSLFTKQNNKVDWIDEPA